MKDRRKYFRDPKISWMEFNHRVLQEAADPSVPLLERIRFLGIYSNNLDEFFRVRVATLYRLMRLKDDKGILSDYPGNPRKILAQITEATVSQQALFEKLYAEILGELEKNGIKLINETQVNAAQARFLREFFHNRLVDALNPVILHKKNAFPPLADANIYLMIDLLGEDEKSQGCALVEVPTGDFSRFIRLPDDGGHRCLMLLEDVIRFNLPELFSSLHYKHFAAYEIKVTRDADLELEQDLSGSLLEKISRGLKNRKKGDAVRLVYDRALPDYLLKFLTRQLQMDADDTMAPGGRYHNFKDFMKFPNLGHPELENPEWPSANVPALDAAGSLLDLARTRDFSLHYPYQNFSYFIRLLREAAIDPDVKAIKITMYRLASNSRIVRTLINAARNGKRVTAVVELLARFDESANVSWARSMQEAGINVVLGVEGLKIHSKLTHITRKGGDIACISTGNFHEGNARVYTDIALVTANKQITSEVHAVFDFILKPYHAPKFQQLLLSPVQMRKKLGTHIRREIAFAKMGKPAWIIGKLNHLADPGIIELLHDAGAAGVKVRLIVRGNCALQTAGCENVEITSIVDRNLEHSRIIIFGNDGHEICYIGSADWMTRNFDGRMEAAIPIEDPEILREMKMIVEYGLKDNTKARIVDGSGENRFKTVAEKEAPFRSQEELFHHYQRKAQLMAGTLTNCE